MDAGDGAGAQAGGEIARLRAELAVLRDRVDALERRKGEDGLGGVEGWGADGGKQDFALPGPRSGSALPDRPAQPVPGPGNEAGNEAGNGPGNGAGDGPGHRTGSASEAALGAVSFVQPERPSLESRIGSQWLNRIGIVAVLTGGAWFLKYAVDRAWLGPGARVLIGLACGLGLMVWSERFRRRGYPVFSFSLKAVGTGLLYLALWASFALLHLVGYPLAFAGMALVTAGNAWLCWRQRSEVLAAYAMAGGFLTPALLDQQHLSIWTLGSYLLLLNAGLLWLLVGRAWPRLLPGAFVGTASYLLGLAMHAETLRVDGQAWSGLGWGVLFFVGFALVPFAVATMQGPQGPQGLRIAMAVTVANAVLGSYELVRLMAAPTGHVDWVPVGVAVWYALLLAGAKARAGVPGAGLALAPSLVPSLAPTLAVLVAAFAAVGWWTVLPLPGTIAGWALEAGCLLLVARRGAGRSPVPGAGLLLASALLLAGASLEPAGVFKSVVQVVWNERFALYLLLTGVTVLAVRLAALKHADGMAWQDAMAGVDRILRQRWAQVGAGSSVMGSVLLLLAGVLEIHTYWQGGRYAGVPTAEQFCISAWAALLGVGLLGLGFRLRWALLRWQALGLLTLAIGKVFLVDMRELSQGFRILSFLGLGVLLLGVSFLYQKDLLKLRGKEHGG